MISKSAKIALYAERFVELVKAASESTEKSDSKVDRQSHDGEPQELEN
jgi:hypothetical protein